MIGVQVGMSDNSEVETAITGNATAHLIVTGHAGTVRLWSLDPAIWPRIAAAATALHVEHVAALSPPRRGMIP